jgi:hypothetical protein
VRFFIPCQGVKLRRLRQGIDMRNQLISLEIVKWCRLSD